MDFELTPEQKEFQRRVREFAVRVLPREYARECEAKDEYPYAFWEKIAQSGYCGLRVPKEYGGSDCSAMETALFLEEIGRQFVAAGMWFMVGTVFPSNLLKQVGSDEQKRRYLPSLARGEIRFCFSLTEPSGGSDVLSLSTFAQERDDGFVINGEKIFTTAADVADYILLVARTRSRDEVAQPHEGLSLFIVPRDTHGITIHKLEKIGWHGVHTCQVFYDDVVVPGGCILGEKDEAWKYVTIILNTERSSGLLLGQAEAAFEYALDYAKQRYAFNRPIGQFQAIQHKLVNMHVMIETLRMWTYRVAWMVDQGMRIEVEGAKGKLVTDHVQQYIAMKGMDILAGHGVMKDHDMERYYRQSPTLSLPKEMCRNVIGHYGLGLPRSY